MTEEISTRCPVRDKQMDGGKIELQNEGSHLKYKHKKKSREL